MATPVFKFNHPDLPNEDLYFVQNTFFELPETIPIDLTTFIYYHLQTDRTLNGLFYCWEDLQETGSTLDGVHFDNFFNDNEKKRLYEDASSSESLYLANINKHISLELKRFISKKQPDQESILYFYNQNAHSAIRHYRCSEYYLSRHHLYKYLFEIETSVVYDYIDEEILMSLYEAHNFPLEFVPHEFRKKDFFKKRYIHYSKLHLLPGIFTDKPLLIDLYESIFPEKLPFHIGDELSNDLDFIKEAIKINGAAIGNASDFIKNDSEIIKMSLPYGWFYIPDEFKNNRDLIVNNIQALMAEFGADATGIAVDFLRENVQFPLNREIAIENGLIFD
jgi:hypothetical protein